MAHGHLCFGILIEEDTEVNESEMNTHDILLLPTGSVNSTQWVAAINDSYQMSLKGVPYRVKTHLIHKLTGEWEKLLKEFVDNNDLVAVSSPGWYLSAYED